MHCVNARIGGSGKLNYLFMKRKLETLLNGNSISSFLYARSTSLSIFLHPPCVVFQIRLPESEEAKVGLLSLLRFIESNRENMGVVHYTLNSTTLEEVHTHSSYIFLLGGVMHTPPIQLSSSSWLDELEL